MSLTLDKEAAIILDIIAHGHFLSGKDLAEALQFVPANHRLWREIEFKIDAQKKQGSAYRQAAKEHFSDAGTIEIDEDAEVSFGEDPGAYVQAWVWVDDAMAGVERCACGHDLGDGEGYDGLCGTCADQKENTKEA